VLQREGEKKRGVEGEREGERERERERERGKESETTSERDRETDTHTNTHTPWEPTGTHQKKLHEREYTYTHTGS